MIAVAQYREQKGKGGCCTRGDVVLPRKWLSGCAVADASLHASSRSDNDINMLPGIPFLPSLFSLFLADRDERAPFGLGLWSPPAKGLADLPRRQSVLRSYSGLNAWIGDGNARTHVKAAKNMKRDDDGMDKSTRQLCTRAGMK